MCLGIRPLTGDAMARAEPFDAIELDLGMVWRGRG